MKTRFTTRCSSVGVALILLQVIHATAADQNDKATKTDGVLPKKTVTTGSLIPQDALRARQSSPLTIITAEDIRRSGASNLAAALRRVPGGR